jgi:hypothetical protein
MHDNKFIIVNYEIYNYFTWIFFVQDSVYSIKISFDCIVVIVLGIECILYKMSNLSMSDSELIEELTCIGDYHELIQLGFEEFISRHPRCVIEVVIKDNTIPKNYVENARKVTIKCIGYKLPPMLNCELLKCFNNLLTSLPDLPNCKELSCSYNCLTSLPDLPGCLIHN